MKFHQKTCLMSVFLFLITCSSTAGKTPLPIKVFTGEWAPYTSQHANTISLGTGGAYGETADIVTVVLQEMGYDPSYEFRHWPQVEKLVQENAVRMGFPFVKSTRREKFFYFSDPIGTKESVLFYNSDQVGHVDDPEKLMARKIGIVESYSYGELITGFNNRQSYQSEQQAFEGLVEGSIDILPAEILVGRQILERYHAKEKHKIKQVEGIKSVNTLHLIISKKDRSGKKFKNEFNKALAKVKELGIFDQILKSYDTQKEKLDIIEVRLKATQSFPHIMATSDELADLMDQSTPKYLIPDNTPAVIVQWGSWYKHPRPSNLESLQQKTNVRILQGPLKDKTLWVPNTCISIAP